MTDFHARPDAPLIDSVDQLVEQFHRAAKPRERWRIGTEWEKPVVDRATGRAASFTGPRGIEALLRGLAEQFAWEPTEDDGHVVALTRGGASISLEPGGQLELSGEQCRSVHCTQKEMTTHAREITTVGRPLGLAFLGLGIQPLSRLDEIEWVPKQRYRIMGPYMATVGTLGHRMMKQTCTVQVNIDYADERDGIRKLRVAQGIAPLVNAMFANSPISDGAPNGFMSFRGHVWTDTDRARCGLLRWAFRDDATFAHYVEWALDVPCYFILRGGRYLTDVTGVPFRRFLADGVGGQRATLDDWNLHLTTLFPEVRLKGYLELRSADSQPLEGVLALPALTRGLFYEPDCLDAAWDLVKRWGYEDVVALYADVTRGALRAKLRGIEVLELARELFAIGEEGLRRLGERDARDRDERIYLDGLGERLAAGCAPADTLARQWAGPWDRKIERLVAGTAFEA